VVKFLSQVLLVHIKKAIMLYLRKQILKIKTEGNTPSQTVTHQAMQSSALHICLVRKEKQKRNKIETKLSSIL